MTIREAKRSERSALLDLWERSVRATHSFHDEAEIQFLRPLVRNALAVLELWAAFDESEGEQLLGFIALEGSTLEAIFLDPRFLRRGIGTRLIEHARQLKGRLTVDVNEENPNAKQFYLANGFVVIGRSERDAAGLPHPLLHLSEPVLNP